MEKMMKSKMQELAEKLTMIKKIEDKIVIGLDGFVDEILHVVDKRINADKYERLRTMREYGERITKAAGLSTNIEMVTIQEKLGGNGPILCNALSSFGLNATYIGCLGFPHVEKVFEGMQSNMKVYSVAKPGHTDAIEFEDGKIMVGKLQSLKEVNWDNIKALVGIDTLIETINDAKLLGLENWTMLPYMNEIWKGLLKEVLPHIDKNQKDRYAFFDLADPEKRTEEDITDALKLIKAFSEYYKVILGLNLKEATEIAKVLKVAVPMNGDQIDLETLIRRVSLELGIYCLVVHPTIEAASYMDGNYYHVTGPYTPKPKLTTGAGDNFNAGFCLGQILGLSSEEALILGVGTSGYYVRNAKSPSFEELVEFLKAWSQDNV